MPSPTETKLAVEPEFDLLAFWIENKTKIAIFAALLFLGLLAFGTFQLIQYRDRQEAARAFASAKNAADYRQLLADHPNTPAAGNAALLLAAELRTQDKLTESSAVLEQLIAKSPNHPLISGACLSQAINLELQAKPDEALAAYQKVTNFYPTSFSAPAAYMAQARILKAKGQTAEAQRAYDSVITQFADSGFAQQARQESQSLKK